MATVPCNCPCQPCYVCNHLAEGSEPGPCPDVESQDPRESYVIVPCCDECLPCRMCYYITRETCQGTCETGSDPAYLVYETCYYDEDENEDVWQWVNEVEPAIVCADNWTIPTLWMQCRRHRDTGDTRLILQAPTAVCIEDDLDVYTLPIGADFLTYVPIEEGTHCGGGVGTGSFDDEFQVHGTFSLLPGGGIGCAGCFIDIRVNRCDEFCSGCLVASPEEYTVTFTGITDDDCDSGHCTRYNATFTMARTIPGDPETLEWEYRNTAAPHCSVGFTHPAGSTGLSLLLRCDGFEWRLQVGDACAPGGAPGNGEYFLDLAGWDCLGENVMTLRLHPCSGGAPTGCTGWPATVTVIPV